ncbi:hypothetical protein SUDANB15_05586 [Streptomyces sp. enrichment culture]|uniref:hypothetical protein n=1 Tax=Streptomyces sp. enrichment culture TaxID=1795815 RepID=UPI003F54F628
MGRDGAAAALGEPGLDTIRTGTEPVTAARRSMGRTGRNRLAEVGEPPSDRAGRERDRRHDGVTGRASRDAGRTHRGDPAPPTRNASHPTRAAAPEAGRARRTVPAARCPRLRDPRREIEEGLDTGESSKDADGRQPVGRP